MARIQGFSLTGSTVSGCAGDKLVSIRRSAPNAAQRGFEDNLLPSNRFAGSICF